MAETRQEYERRQRAHRLRRGESKSANASASNNFFKEYFLSAVGAAVMAIGMLWVSVPMILRPYDDYVRGFRLVGTRVTPRNAPIVAGVAVLLLAYAVLCFYGIWRHRQRRLAREFEELDRLTRPDP
jgi:Flp pilus assembly protein TadB